MILLLIFYVIKTLILNPIVTALFIRGRKLNISFVFITQSYFAVQKNRLNSVQYFTMKIQNILELQQIAFYYSSNIIIDFKDFVKL